MKINISNKNLKKNLKEAVRIAKKNNNINFIVQSIAYMISIYNTLTS